MLFGNADRQALGLKNWKMFDQALTGIRFKNWKMFDQVLTGI